MNNLPSEGFRKAAYFTSFRIERLWREIWAGVTSLYYGLFYFLEDQGLLQMENELHLQVLHLVYIPLIQHQLDRFMAALQRRPLRTEHNQSPLQLWVNGQVHADDMSETEVLYSCHLFHSC